MSTTTTPDTTIAAPASPDAPQRETPDIGGITTLPFSCLRQHPEYNVRGDSECQGIVELARSIQTHGLLQNLSVASLPRTKGARSKTTLYGVAAGRRRFAALTALFEEGAIKADTPIPVRIGEADQALIASFVENVDREPMDAVDQYLAFRKMHEAGKSDEDIAAAFFCEPTLVRRRLRLAGVHAELLQAYRDGHFDLETLMAFASCDDPERQLAIFQSFSSSYGLTARSVRQLLHGEELDAGKDALAGFVGAEAFEAAGGQIRKDLFASHDHPGFWSARELLESLAEQKLAPMAEAAKRDGWKWVTIVPRLNSAPRYEHVAAPRRLVLSPKHQERVDAIRARLDEIDSACDAIYDEREQYDESEDGSGGESSDDEALAALDKRQKELDDEREKLSREQTKIEAKGRSEFEPGVQSYCGAFVGVDVSGNPVVDAGYMTRSEARTWADKRRDDESEKVDRAEADGSLGEADEDDQGGSGRQPPLPRYPKHIWTELTTARTAALQARVAASPKVALALLATQLAGSIVSQRAFPSVPVNLMGRSCVESKPHTSGSGTTRMRELRARWETEIEAIESETLFQTLLTWPETRLAELLAFCVGATVEGVNDTGRISPESAGIAAAVDLDMHDWWEPSTEFFRKTQKSTSLSVIRQFAPGQVRIAEKGKKEPAAAMAGELARKNGWLPPIFEGAGKAAASQQAGGEQPSSDVGSEAADGAGEEGAAAE